MAQRAREQIGSYAWGSGENTECLRFVQDLSAAPWLGSSAIDGWWRWPSFRVGNPEIGDFPYFAAAPSNGWWGHVGILVDDDRMVSVSYYGVREDSVSWWRGSQAELLGFQRWW